MDIYFKQSHHVDELTVIIKNHTKNDEVEQVLTYLSDYEEHAHNLTIEKDGEVHKIPFTTILWIEVIGDYTTVHTDQIHISFRKTLQSIEAELPAKYFVRASRNTLVNIKKITKVESKFSGTMRGILSQNQSIHISRKYWKTIKQRILNHE